jgi:DnaK suppressor protein
MNSTRVLDPGTATVMAGLLRARRAALSESLRHGMSEERPDDLGGSQEFTARATATLHDEIRAALLDRQSRQLTEINAALERLERGEYGFCRDCGANIGLARLKALPFAWRCSRCQRRAERRARQTRPPLVSGIRVTPAFET